MPGILFQMWGCRNRGLLLLSQPGDVMNNRIWDLLVPGLWHVWIQMLLHGLIGCDLWYIIKTGDLGAYVVEWLLLYSSQLFHPQTVVRSYLRFSPGVQSLVGKTWIVQKQNILYTLSVSTTKDMCFHSALALSGSLPALKVFDFLKLRSLEILIPNPFSNITCLVEKKYYYFLFLRYQLNFGV